MARFAEAFWAFSLELYARPGIQAQLLRLQDEYRLNVNLILLMLFLAERRTRLGDDVLLEASQCAHRFEATHLNALRKVRRHLKPEAAAHPHGELHAFRESVKEAELAGEKALQAELAEIAANALEDGREPRTIARDGMERYGRLRADANGAVPRQDIEALLVLAFPG